MIDWLRRYRKKKITYDDVIKFMKSKTYLRTVMSETKEFQYWFSLKLRIYEPEVGFHWIGMFPDYQSALEAETIAYKKLLETKEYNDWRDTWVGEEDD